MGLQEAQTEAVEKFNASREERESKMLVTSNRMTALSHAVDLVKTMAQGTTRKDDEIVIAARKFEAYLTNG